MTDDEIRQAFQQLALMLTELDMEWVVDQVRDDIRAGQTTTRKEPIQDSATERKLKVSADSLTSVPYSALQELELIIEAIRRSVVDAALMEQEVIALLAPQEVLADLSSFEVIFVSDPPDATEKVIASPQGLTPQRIEAVARLSSALESLLEDARAS